MNTDFSKFAQSLGVSTSVVDDVTKSVNKSGLILPTNSLTPVVLEEREMRCTPVDVFSRMMLDRKIFFGTEFNTDACNVVVAELLYLASLSNDDIQIMVNSPGGSVIDGLGVIDTINYISCDVSTLCVGMAASMGAVLLASGTNGKRFVLPHSRVMIHQVSSHASGRVSDMEIEYKQAKRCEQDLYNILSEKMGKSYQEIEELCKADNWFIGEEAVKLGIADRVIQRH